MSSAKPNPKLTPEELYVVRLTIVFSHFLGHTFSVRSIIEETFFPAEHGQQDIEVWLRIALRRKDVESVGKNQYHEKVYSFTPVMRTKLEKHFSQRPPGRNALLDLPEIVPPLQNYLNARVEHLVDREEVHRFFVRVIAHRVGSGWITRHQLIDEMLNYTGWGNVRSATNSRHTRIIEEMIHRGLLKQEGPTRRVVFRITVLAAVEHLNWPLEYARALKMPISKT